MRMLARSGSGRLAEAGSQTSNPMWESVGWQDDDRHAEECRMNRGGRLIAVDVVQAIQAQLGIRPGRVYLVRPHAIPLT